MFELERAIADWRQQMAASGVKSSEILNELESHLRDEIARQMQAGVAARQAFENAVQSIGSAHALKEECAKVSGRPSKLLQALKRFILGRHGVSMADLRLSQTPPSAH